MGNAYRTVLMGRSSLKDLHKLQCRGVVEATEGLWKPFRLQRLDQFTMGVAHRYALQAFQAWDSLRTALAATHTIEFNGWVFTPQNLL